VQEDVGWAVVHAAVDEANAVEFPRFGGRVWPLGRGVRW
jgi:hypothetical protein